ncbi:hypothetical protein LCGC14_1888520 [marine sediment metagenome]|uniref:Uncharacterized protein n=1 Tax=marine sediment metagenome TaxID=412755 RepID=A0A0F9G0D2_9ZZZZ
MELTILIFREIEYLDKWKGSMIECVVKTLA